MQLTPQPELTARFAAGLDRLVPPDQPVGIAVSGGPDSLALLLLAAAARPGKIEAATVDHQLRTGSDAEAARVAELCQSLSVAHETLTAQWDAPPVTGIQQRARVERYRLLSGWLAERRLPVLATAHHLDDQAETLLMRLARGAGVRGLGAIRALAPLPGGRARLVRPLLGWRRSELREICQTAGVEPETDPSNEDEQFERVRIRKALADASWLDPRALGRSAANLTRADVALDWAAAQEWERSVNNAPRQITYRPGTAPGEIRRRIAVRAIASLATEGGASGLRSRELDRLLAALAAGDTATLRGVRCSGGEIWTFAPAPRRRIA